jgi:polysaccharide export outer membrane protein
MGSENDGESVTEYRLSAGDSVLVTVFGHEDLSGEFDINGANVISMPLIPEIEAAGLTVNELEAAIVDALKPDYLKNPSVSVDVTNFRPFYIIGEVASPGSYPYSNKMTVVNAVALAGGFTYRAKKNKAVIKRTEGAASTEIEAEMDTMIEPGDVIEIRERFF